MRMGAGIAFRENSHGLTDTLLRVSGHVTTFVAEGAAASHLFGVVRPDVPLTVMTDSANIMFAMQQCTRREKWRDFDYHPDKELMNELALKQAARTAPTCWVKIKSHTSVMLNKRADRLATAAPDSDEAWLRMYNEQIDDDFIQFYRLVDNEEARVDSKQLCNHFIQIHNAQVTRKMTRTIRKLRASGTGRAYFHQALWQCNLEAKVVKSMLQCLTNTFPTQKRLWVMKKVDSPQCRSCTEDKNDTLFPWQQECPGFHDTCTQVHNDIWKAVFSTLKTHLPKG